jgi:hypothetical protein
MRRRALPLAVAVAALAGALAVPARPAAAWRIRPPDTGRDISFPQCGEPFPLVRVSRFGIVGVNGGKAFSANPCLAEQLRWAKRLVEAPAFYANTGNPGPERSRHWPLGQTSPQRCSPAQPDSFGCSYDYGWNAAEHSFALAAAASREVNGVSPADARHRVAHVDWWLDVEILNSWQTLDRGRTRAAQLRDTATLLGAVNALWDAGVHRVGIYSTRYQWNLVTGGPAVHRDWFRANPVWLAGFEGHEHAHAGCDRAGFTGGPVLLTQYLGDDGFDANVRCA